MITDQPGIVLSGMKYRETGKILRLFTRDYGILPVMAHGVYKKNSTLLSVTEWFAKAHYDLDAGRNFYYLRHAELIDLHYPLRADYQRIRSAQLAGLFLLRSIPEEHAQEELYTLFSSYLAGLQHAKSPVQLTTAFLLQAAAHMGYQPLLSACASCGNRKIRSMRFSHRLGGILCENCRIPGEYPAAFSKDSYMNIYTLLRKSFAQISEENEPPTAQLDQSTIRTYLQSAMGWTNRQTKKRK